jgi:hypothetical protein
LKEGSAAGDFWTKSICEIAQNEVVMVGGFSEREPLGHNPHIFFGPIYIMVIIETPISGI